jgi:hypothetical protein
MTQSPNQFNQTPETGELDQSTPGQVLNSQVSSAQATPIVAGDKVKLEDSAGGVPKVLKTTADLDKTFGIATLSRKDINYEADDRIEVAIDHAIIWQVAGAAIARGAQLEVVASTQKVITNAGTNPILGLALDKAAADGDLIRVFVQALTQDVSEANSLVQVVTTNVTLAELNAGKTIIPAVTGKQIRVVGYTVKVTGTFITLTSADLQDESAQKVTVLAAAALVDAAILVPADGALGALYARPLTLSEALVIANVGAAAAGGTDLDVTVLFELV